MKARVLLARIELEGVRRPPGSTADEGGDLVPAILGTDVVPALALGPKRDPVAFAVGADAQTIGVLPVALAVALDDRADAGAPAAVGDGLSVRLGHACLRGPMGGTTLRAIIIRGSGSTRWS
jgi:hypothetical protein